MIGWYGTAMLCYVTPKEHLGLPNRDDVERHHRLQDRRPRRRPGQGHHPGAQFARRRASRRASISAGRTSSTWPGSGTPRANTTTTLPKRIGEGGAFLLDVRAKFCSMKITQLDRTRGTLQELFSLRVQTLTDMSDLRTLLGHVRRVEKTSSSNFSNSVGCPAA